MTSEQKEGSDVDELLPHLKDAALLMQDLGSMGYTARLEVLARLQGSERGVSRNKLHEKDLKSGLEWLEDNGLVYQVSDADELRLTPAAELFVGELLTIAENATEVRHFGKLADLTASNPYIVQGFEALTENYIYYEKDIPFNYGHLVASMESIREIVVTINLHPQFRKRQQQIDAENIEYIYTPRARRKVLQNEDPLKETAIDHQKEGVTYLQIAEDVNSNLTELHVEKFERNSHTEIAGQLPFNLALMELDEEVLDEGYPHNTEKLQKLDLDEPIVVLEALDKWQRLEGPQRRLLWLSDTDAARTWAEEIFTSFRKRAEYLPWSYKDPSDPKLKDLRDFREQIPDYETKWDTNQS